MYTWFLGLLVSSSLLAIPTLTREKTVDCVNSDFQKDNGPFPSAWLDLNNKDKRLFAFIKKLSTLPGQGGWNKIKPTNCRISYPVTESDGAVDGFCTLIIDYVWKENREVQQAGVKLVYNVKYAKHGQYKESVRSVHGFSECDRPEACRLLGIPLGDNKEGPTTLTAKNIAPKLLIANTLDRGRK